MTQSIKLVKRYKNFFPFILIFLVVFLAYWQTLRMYIWQDDNAIFFKLQHLEEGAGNLGRGIYDRNSSYRFVMVPLVPLFQVFGMEPTGYFVAGIVAYFLVAIAVFFLTKTLTNNRKVSWAAAAIFAAGYIGGETLWRIFNSIHTSLIIIFICLSLAFYRKFIDKRSLYFYLLSLFLFTLAIETGYVRAHGIVVMILAMEFFFGLRKKLLNLVVSLVSILPFTYIYYRWYIGDNTSAKQFSQLMGKIFSDGQYELLLSPLQTLQNIFIPDVFPVSFGVFLIGLTALLIWKRQRIFWFTIAFMIAGFIVPYIHNLGQSFASLHRYLTLSLVGFSIFTATFLNVVFKDNKKYILSCAAIVIVHLALINIEQAKIVESRGIPTRSFYQSLIQQIPRLEKGSALYFDVRQDPKSINEFYHFFGVGSMPETTAIAIYYGLDRYDLFLPATFNEVLTLLRDKKIDPSRLYTFFYSSSQGLVNTTNKTYTALFGKKEIRELLNPDEINFSSATPVRLKFIATTTLDEQQVKYNDQGKIDLATYQVYLNSKNNYYREVSATASAEWRYQEVANVVDNDKGTSWMAHRGTWHYQRYAELTLDLGEKKTIGAVRLILRSVGKAPVKYSYQCSINGVQWTNLGTFYNEPKIDSETKVDKFAPATCRLLKLEIKDTAGDDEPQLSEIEVIEDQFKSLDFDLGDKIAENILNFISSEEDLTIASSYLRNNGVSAEICYLTDRNNDPNNPSCSPTHIKFETSDNYSIIIPAEGVKLEKVFIKVPPEFGIKVENPSLETLNLQELEDNNYIFNYVNN